MKIQWMGLVDYAQALENMAVVKEDQIWGLEHPSVVTLGHRAKASEELRPVNAKEDPLPVHQTHRGGHATLHSPGQLVIYPLLDLRARGLGVRHYVSLLEASTEALLKTYGVHSGLRYGEPGLYTSVGKMAFFGVRVRQGRTEHGLSLNVRNDLSLFSRIRSCGRDQESFDSMARYGVQDSLQRLFNCWVDIFLEKLNSPNLKAKGRGAKARSFFEMRA